MPFYIEMQSSCLLHIIFAFSSLISTTAQDVIGSSHSCLKSSPADDGRTRVTFLREDAAGERALYLSLWSEETQPVACEVNTNPLVTERYQSLCDTSGTDGQETMKRFNVSMLFVAPDAPCALVSSSAPKLSRRTRRDLTEGKTRRKRAWIFPGTLWCGHGSRAAGYEQLGMFESADRCCREHDHCLHIIPSFTLNYGIFNSNFYTVSHCDCDHRFRQCLLGVNDTISNMVGYSFFNILRVPCFDLKKKRHCTEMYWWGGCKVVKKGSFGILKNSIPYNSSDVTSKYETNSNSNSSLGQQGNGSFVINPHRKSFGSKHRCSSRDPSTGDTFYLNRTKGKGCKRHRKLFTAAPTKMPLISTTHTTTPSMTTGVLNVTESSASTANKKRAGKKKSTRKGFLTSTTQVTTSSHPHTSTTQMTTASTQKPALSTATAATKPTKSRRKVPKQRHCCGLKKPLRGDTFQPHCKNCPQQNTTSHVTTVTPSTTTHGIKLATTTTARLKETTETPKQDTLKRLWSTATSATPLTTRLQTAAPIHEDGKQQKQTESPLMHHKTSQGPIAQSTHVERGLKRNTALHNLTDNQLLCGSLKLLDDCKYKIHPLGRKYHLRNTESKTAYHCDCTSRLAVHIESFKQPSVLSKLLMDFVSQYCIKLTKKKNCHSGNSCSGSFTKASDLLQALKMMDEKDTAGVRNSRNARKRGIPARLYKRCLRLEREADVMVQLAGF
ncbi:group 3 secretory phospholipase A2-like [Centropristis striata]|uniref:group 3 secretory phospholipase A2-like n=1 Tax=Centropristis striata TaxID=184440 RepID=UPI0027DEDFE1|nr:group 3 secretory phospholipase A2-like [Centropristis striata]